MNATIQHIQNQIKSLYGQIEYCNEVLSSDIENWERKEYEGVMVDVKAELEYMQGVLERYTQK